MSDDTIQKGVLYNGCVNQIATHASEGDVREAAVSGSFIRRHIYFFIISLPPLTI